jgi:uncharacterized membrane protein
MSVATIIWLATAAAPTVDMKNLPVPLACFGGEPFWSLQIRDASNVRYKDDLEHVALRITRVDNAMLRPSTWRLTFEGNESHALIFDEHPQCSDSDGDEPWPYGLILERDGGLLRGCCRPANDR